MKNIALIVIVASSPLIAFAFVPKHSAAYYETQKPEVQEAWRKGAKAKIIYRIVDDVGNPLVNQRVHYVWQNDYPRKTWGEYANTDTNGEFVAQAKVKFGETPQGRYAFLMVQRRFFRLSCFENLMRKNLGA